MKQGTRFLVMFVLLTTIFVQSIKADKKADYTSTYNFKRATEMLDENKLNEAITYFKAEVNDHRDNGYAYSMIAYVQNYQQVYGEALENVNLALKYLPKKDDFYSFALRVRSEVHRGLEDNKSALADMNLRVKMFKKEADAYADRAQYFVDIDDYVSAMKDFEKASELEQSNAVHYVGRGLCLRALERYDEALALFDYALKLDPSYSNAYSQRGYCRMLKKDYKEAAVDIVSALDIDGNSSAFYNMQVLADSAFDVMNFRLKIMQMSEPLESTWPYYRAIIYENDKRYKEAIELFEKANKISFNSIIMNRIAWCKSEMGDFEGALEAINDALSADSSDVDYLRAKAEFLHNLGRKEECYRTMDRVIELTPTSAYSYQLKGWYETCNRDYDAAIEDESMAIMLFPEYIMARYSRGKIYLEREMMKEAEEDFKMILEVDTVEGNYMRAQYVHLDMGDREKAFACMQANLKKDSVENFYDAACLYSLAKENDMALHYLRRALETGFVKFKHIEEDRDLDNIRNSDEFKSMIDEFKGKVDFNKSEVKSDESEKSIVEIPFTHEGGVTKIKCVINGLPLFFIFDTGASDVTISTIEATFMLKNGYLAERDLVGRQNYMTADGNISEGTTIMLRKVKIGDLELDDVKASVVKNQNAPLLLGQSVLQRLGRIEIDNHRDIIKVTKK